MRLGVFDPQSDLPAQIRSEDAARFSIDRAALDAYLRELGNDRSEGPPVASALGQRPPSPAAPQRLKALLLDGARESAEGRPVVAASRYREARALCAQEKMILEEALVLITLGGACLTAGAPNAAIESYRQAAELAKAKDAWGVVCQAWLGAGGAELTRKVYAPAALAYRAAAEAAQQGEIPALGIEARRLEGTCWLLAGSEEDAMNAWQEGLDLGDELRGKERAASTLPAVATAFAELLESRGLMTHAAHVRAVLHRLSTGASGDASPGKRLVRFDSQTGEALPSPVWDDLPEVLSDAGDDQ